MKQWILSTIFVGIEILSGIEMINASNIQNPEASITFINLIEISTKDIDKFVLEWNKNSQTIGQTPGYISATLYRSLLRDAQYQLIATTQWQSYEAWMVAERSPIEGVKIKGSGGLYRPTAWSTNTNAESFKESGKKASVPKGKPLKRAKKDPEIKFLEKPFVFINLMEMNSEDIASFVSDWKVRSKIMGQMSAAMGSTLYRSVEQDSTFKIVNVSQWQSYSGFIDANNDPAYAEKLEADLGHTSSIKLTRGFYRPVATYTHIYGDVYEK